MSNADWSHWVAGLVAAFVGGMAGAVDSGLALMVLDADKFNLGPGLKHTLLVITVLGILTGAKVMFAYLKQSPLPADVLTVTKTTTQTTAQTTETTKE